tara:strand:- start:919 stop:1173 length:255 start_codon:yes stop_codon:yes gene_type:complete
MNYKKIIIVFFLSVFGIIIISKYTISFVRNEILYIIKSDKFDTFLINIFDNKLQRLAKAKISPEKKSFYIENFKIIIDKFKEEN